MKLALVPPSRQQAAVERRLSTALRIEAYFRGLSSSSHEDEVRRQWQAAQRLVSKALTDFAAQKMPVEMMRFTTAG